MSIRYRYQGPGKRLGIELQAVICLPVSHVKDVYHPLALFGGVAQAGLGEVHALAVVLHPLWEAVKAVAPVMKVIGYDADIFTDTYSVFHF